MKLKLKAIAAAIAFTVAGGEQAAYELPSTTDAGVVISVFDEVVGVGISFGLNLTYSDIVASSGSVLTALSGTNYNFGTTFATSNVNDIQWNITSGSNPGGAGTDFLMFSSAQVAPAANNGAMQSSLGAMETYYDNARLSNATISGNPALSWGTAFNGTSPTINNATGLGGVMDLFVLTTTGTYSPRGGLTYSNGTPTTQFAFYDLNMSLSSVGDFTAAAVVPVPAALWLFGAGLMGLVGVARRRQAA